MAGTKISALTAGAALGGTEALPAVQTAATVKITADQIKTFVSASPTLVTPVLGVASATSLTLPDGTFSAPAIANATTPNTGIYFGGGPNGVAFTRAGQLDAYFNGSGRFISLYGATFSGAGGLSNPQLNLTGTWITGGTATTTKPIVLIEPEGTTSTGWSTAGTGLGVNAASGFAGNLLDLQLNGAAAFKVDSSGNAIFGSGGNVILSNNGAVYLGAGLDLILRRSAAATLQHGAADAASPVAQTIKFQDVVAGTSNTAGVNATIQAPAGTGTGAGGSLIFQVAPAGSSGSAKNAWATALTIASNKDATFTGGYLTASAGYVIANNGFFGQGANGAGLRGSGTDGILLLNSAENAFGSLKFGGTTSSFPALKRSTTALQARLADDSDFTAIQGKLTTDTAYVATPQVPTGYITIYDSTGTAYKVSVNV